MLICRIQVYKVLMDIWKNLVSITVYQCCHDIEKLCIMYHQGLCYNTNIYHGIELTVTITRQTCTYRVLPTLGGSGSKRPVPLKSNQYNSYTYHWCSMQYTLIQHTAFQFMLTLGHCPGIPGQNPVHTLHCKLKFRLDVYHKQKLLFFIRFFKCILLLLYSREKWLALHRNLKTSQFTLWLACSPHCTIIYRLASPTTSL